MKLASSVSDIEIRVNDINQLTAWSPVPLGSILRVSDYAYPNWGIRVTDQNRDWLYSASQDAYSVEWKDTDPSLNALVSQASTNAGLGDVNSIMNQKIGDYAYDYVAGFPRNRDKCVIADIGAGAGATSIAIAKALFDSESRKPVSFGPVFEFVLIEPSSSRLAAASNAINRLKDEYRIPHSLHVRCIASTEIAALREYEGSAIDIAVANASIHHNSFTDHLAEISRSLKIGASFIIGDWYDGLSERPARIYWMLALIAKRDDAELVSRVLRSIENREELKMGIKSSELKNFRKYFSLTGDELRFAFMANNPKQALADAGIVRFWLEVGKIFAEKEVKSPIYALEGHERVAARKRSLVNSGFCFDEDSKTKYAELSRKIRKGDLATVMVAKKARV